MHRKFLMKLTLRSSFLSYRLHYFQHIQCRTVLAKEWSPCHGLTSIQLEVSQILMYSQLQQSDYFDYDKPSATTPNGVTCTVWTDLTLNVMATSMYSLKIGVLRYFKASFEI